jgi:GT2 family glycosyltransferase
VAFSRPPLSAVIPTYHALRYLPACLTALQAQLQDGDEIILVDNASRDHAGDWVERWFPGVQVLRLPLNLGFAGGTNAGLAAARNPLLLLINDDALLEPGGVAALTAALGTDAQIGAVAGTLVFARRPQIVASGGIVMHRDGVARDARLGSAVDAAPAGAPLFGASGGLALLRRELLDDIGDFADFFAYLEDADLAWRAQLRGWRTVAAAAARARHVYSATGGAGSAFKQELLGRNRLRLLLRCVPSELLPQLWAALLRYEALVIAHAAVSGRPAIIRGRLQVRHELSRLLAERRAIQARRSVDSARLQALLAPAPGPLQLLRDERRLQQFLTHD